MSAISSRSSFFRRTHNDDNSNDNSRFFTNASHRPTSNQPRPICIEIALKINRQRRLTFKNYASKQQMSLYFCEYWCTLL